MKKAARIFFIAAGALVVLLAIAVIVLLQPPVQTWLARKVASGQPGYEISIGRVDAGLGRVEITSVRVKGQGMMLELPQASVEMSLPGLIREKVDVKKLVAKGWTLDLSQPAATASASAASTTATGTAPASDAKTPAPAPASAGQPGGSGGSSGSSGAFNGIFEMLQLPVDLAVDEADIEGTVILPPETPGEAPTRATVSVRGGQLRPGNDGRFDLALKAALPGKDAPVSNIEVTGNLVVRMGTPRDIQSLVFETDATASGAQLPRGARLQGTVGASKNASGEDYVISLKSQASEAEKNLLRIKATNPSGPEGLNAMWVVDVRDSDIAPFTSGLGVKLPAFAASGQGTFATDDDFKGFHAAGKLTGGASQLEIVNASLSAPGHMDFTADFDVMSEGDLLRIGVLSVDISSAAPVASVKTLQLIEINTATGEIKVPNLQSDLIRVDIHGIPPAWAQPFIKDTGLAVTGDPLRGSFTGRAQGDGYSLHSATPFTLSHFSVSQGGGQLAKDLDVSTGFTAAYSNAAWNFSVSDLLIRSNGATLASVPEARVCGTLPPPAKGAPKITATGKLTADIPAIFAQPVAAGLCVLTSGALDADFSGNIENGLTAVAAKIAATGLRAGGKALPKISADVRADLHDNGTCEVEAPIVFDLNGRKSDIQFGATLKPDGARGNIDASVASDAVYVDDLMTLTAALPASPEDAATAPTGTPPAQPETGGAPWDGISGELKFLLKKVVYSADIQASNVGGAVKISPSLLSLENLRAVMQDGGEMKADGSVKYNADAGANTYATDARLTLTNFDPGPFLKAANPGEKPTVEGKFDITGSVSGTAASLDKIASTTGADLTLTNRGGKFNGFATSTQSSGIGQLLKTASAVSTLGAISDKIMSALGKSDNSPNLDKVKAGARILERLTEIDFDQLNLEASYRPGQEIVVKNFGLLSPDMRISGAGSLGNNPALSLLKQALAMNLQMAVRGEQADDLRILGLLKREADTLGYTPLVKDFAVDGTITSLGAGTLVKPIISSLTAK